MEGKAREEKRNQVQSHFPNWGMGSFILPRLAEAYSLTIMNILTTPTRGAYHPLTRGANWEMWEKRVFHLDTHLSPIWVSWCQVRSELYLFDDFSYTFDNIVWLIIFCHGPFGSHSRQRKKESLRSSSVNVLVRAKNRRPNLHYTLAYSTSNPVSIICQIPSEIPPYIQALQ